VIITNNNIINMRW